MLLYDKRAKPRFLTLDIDRIGMATVGAGHSGGGYHAAILAKADTIGHLQLQITQQVLVSYLFWGKITWKLRNCISKSYFH